MATAIAPGAHPDLLVRFVPGGAPSLAQVTDEELLANTRRLVGKTNQLLAALLLHLAEVETRGIHRIRLCASLYTYCIYELRFSEDAAARRSAAARFVKQFPALLDAVAAGELHLTGLLMIGPHLTLQNQLDVLGRAKFRTKKELAKLVRDLDPLPSLRDCVEPLGPEPRRNQAWTPGWHSPPVRELPEGERPRDWMGNCDEGEPVRRREPEGDLESQDGDGGAGEAALPVGPIPVDLPPVTKPQQYGLQFSTVQEHVQLIEKAKALLARERPDITLGELHLEAMKVLVASLEKRKFAVTKSPTPLTDSAPPRQRGETVDAPDDVPKPPRQRDGAADKDAERGALRPRDRYIPAAIRRQVYERDCGRCGYVDARGERCKETRFLEFHHIEAFAKGGQHEAANLALRCTAHNAMAAEQDFGREHVLLRRDSARHESLSRER